MKFDFERYLSFTLVNELQMDERRAQSAVALLKELLGKVDAPYGSIETINEGKTKHIQFQPNGYDTCLDINSIELNNSVITLKGRFKGDFDSKVALIIPYFTLSNACASITLGNSHYNYEGIYYVMSTYNEDFEKTFAFKYYDSMVLSAISQVKKEKKEQFIGTSSSELEKEGFDDDLRTFIAIPEEASNDTDARCRWMNSLAIAAIRRGSIETFKEKVDALFAEKAKEKEKTPEEG